MSVSLDKRRNKYIVRVSNNGTRSYIGSYDTKEEARSVELLVTPSELSLHKCDYIKDDVSIAWLKGFRISKTLKKLFKIGKN